MLGEQVTIPTLWLVLPPLLLFWVLWILLSFRVIDRFTRLLDERVRHRHENT